MISCCTHAIRRTEEFAYICQLIDPDVTYFVCFLCDLQQTVNVMHWQMSDRWFQSKFTHSWVWFCNFTSQKQTDQLLQLHFTKQPKKLLVMLPCPSSRIDLDGNRFIFPFLVAVGEYPKLKMSILPNYHSSFVTWPQMVSHVYILYIHIYIYAHLYSEDVYTVSRLSR